MAKMISAELGGDMDIVLVRKIGAPRNPEYAVGAVDEFGNCYMDDYALTFFDKNLVNERYIEVEKEKQLAVMHKRRISYSSVHKYVEPSDRIVIVVDDGLATGSTMIAALKSLRAKSPKKLICAVPVAPTDTLKKITAYADEIVCIDTPILFHSVGQFYYSFPQVSDEEVLKILAE